MREFLKRLDKEVLWGGIFGLIAIMAILAEMCLSGISAVSIAAAIKDIAGTIIAVMVFVVAAKHILKQMREMKSFEGLLQKALDNWQDDHKNMIVRKEQYDYEKTGEAATCYSLGLKTNISDFYNLTASNNTGWFLRMPLIKKENYVNGNVVLRFHLNKGTFFEGKEMSKEELTVGFNRLNALFIGFMQASFGDLINAQGKNQDITVTITKPICTAEDIDFLISIINSMYNAYLVAANLN